MRHHLHDRFRADKIQSTLFSLAKSTQVQSRPPFLCKQSLDHFGWFDADEFLVEALERECVFVGIDA